MRVRIAQQLRFGIEQGLRDEAFVRCVQSVNQETTLSFQESVEYVSEILRDITKLETAIQIKQVITEVDIEASKPRPEHMLDNTRKIRV